MKTIYKKELARIFKDKKMIFSVFLLPVLIMVGIMALVGNLATRQVEDIENHRSIVYMINEPDSFSAFLEAADLNMEVNTIKTDGERENVMDLLRNGDADLLIEFPENFDSMIQEYQTGDEVPQIKTYYNPSEDYSSSAYELISNQTLEAYRQTLLSQRVADMNGIQIFTVNSDNKDMIVQDDQKASGKALGMMLPYFITILLFAGAMGIGTDMIAGEKERGTMASLLVTPVKRKSIVLGKVFALMTISGISSVIYIVVMGATFPKILGGDSGLDIEITPEQIAMIGVLLVAISFLYSAIVILISVFARDLKEASTYITPAYMVVLVIGMMTMFTTSEAGMKDYLIPFYNTALALKGILTSEVTMAQYGVTLVMTLVLGGILTAVIAKAFESEKVMNL
ncbi:ABC transporter permease [Drancourtella massiliensis]|uniref:ABC transporter permease n=1 Tax=Drancourtella massiliensis TaxID=1632013 RepID=A0ABS2EGR4_9FIRM|nr:ABC transporter permease [Drancourtella massiliensis]MBM6744165.1 ABC transporter permease [Drancourtella massiliensis]